MKKFYSKEEAEKYIENTTIETHSKLCPAMGGKPCQGVNCMSFNAGRIYDRKIDDKMEYRAVPGGCDSPLVTGVMEIEQ